MAGALLIVGCGSVQPSEITQGAVRFQDLGPVETETTLGAAALQDLSSLESEVLADRTVSEAELERAGQAFVECLVEGGFETSVSGPPFGPDEVFASLEDEDGISLDGSAEAVEQADAHFENCRAVAVSYTHLTLPTICSV